MQNTSVTGCKGFLSDPAVISQTKLWIIEGGKNPAEMKIMWVFIDCRRKSHVHRSTEELQKCVGAFIPALCNSGGQVYLTHSSF